MVRVLGHAEDVLEWSQYASVQGWPPPGPLKSIYEEVS